MVGRHCRVALVSSAIALAQVATTARATEPQRVSFAGSDGLTLQALMYKPAGATAGPAIVALHGCGGNYRPDGSLVGRVGDWTERWLAAGYTVLWPDSFGSRGLGPQCTVSNRVIRPADRAGDAIAALGWLGSQPFVDPARIGLVGWSNGASTVLQAVRPASAPNGPDFKLAIAFYPGCRPVIEGRRPWSSRVALTILMGGADNWTSPKPCRELALRDAKVRYVEYPGAYHDFDAPNLPIRERRNLAFTADGSGRAFVGTDAAARSAAIQEVTRTLAEAFAR